MFQVSGELCLLADVIQRQYLLIRICTGDRADGQDHVELSVTVSVCADVHADVLIGQRPIAAFRQELIRITARNCSILCVELYSGSAAYRLQKDCLIHIQCLQQARCGELLAAGDVIQIPSAWRTRPM